MTQNRHSGRRAVSTSLPKRWSAPTTTTAGKAFPTPERYRERMDGRGTDLSRRHRR